MDCLFCKIIKGEIPSYKVYEDDYILAFLDIHPCAKGHTVVIPKKHTASISTMSLEEWNAVNQSLKTVIKRVEDVLKPDGLNIGINERPASGQAVPHSHWHIIPRWEGDGGGSMHSIIKVEEDINVEGTAKLFK